MSWTVPIAALLSLFTPLPEDSKDSVKVYILAGQSNMEGKAKLSLLETQAKDPKTAEFYEPWRQGDEWIRRDDVWIKFLDREGPLTVGFGSPGCVGPELEFGRRVGDAHEEPVLLIKTAWGGKSLFRDFRPPSAGLPNDEVLGQDLERMKKRSPDATLEDVRASYGKFYRAMIADIQRTLDSEIDFFSGQKDYELAGFVWFQGWNDMVNPSYTAAYGENLTHLIRDVRKDLACQDLPFVVGQLGVGGVDDKPNPGRDRFKEAQASVMKVDEFKETVSVVKTDVLWDTVAHEVFKKGWKEHIDEWNQVGSDYPFHYLGSGIGYGRMGKAFAEAALKLSSGH